MTKWYNKITINGKRVRLSRWLMEQHLNRKLSSAEIVHHIDGNPRNNIINNLQVILRTKHIRECNRKRTIGNNKGSKHGGSKLIEGDVLEIRQRLRYGVLVTLLAKEYNVTTSTIDAIKHRITWKHI